MQGEYIESSYVNLLIRKNKEGDILDIYINGIQAEFSKEVDPVTFQPKLKLVVTSQNINQKV